MLLVNMILQDPKQEYVSMQALMEIYREINVMTDLTIIHAWSTFLMFHVHRYCTGCTQGLVYSTTKKNYMKAKFKYVSCVQRPWNFSNKVNLYNDMITLEGKKIKL